MSKPVVVIGAGLAGLNASLELQKAGREVILLESSNRAGGRVQSDQIDGFICDRGFQLINAKYPELVALDVIEELDFRFADPVINVILANQVHKLGDPRKHLLSVFDSATGTLFEKAAILKVLLGKANPEQSIADYLSSSGLGKTYERVLKPFLRGVYLTKLENISAPVGLEIIRTFITGRPGLPGAGAGALTQALSKRVNDLRVGITVQSISKGIVRTEDSEIAASEIIVATDSTTAAQLLDLPSVRRLAGCTTWYHGADVSPVSHGQLVIDGQERGCVINTLVISNFIPEFASGGKCLISTTTDNGATESDVRRHLAIIYGCENRNWDLIAKYEIPAALPIGAKRITQPIESLVSEGIYLAGDAQVGPSQNGALKSGRLAASAILAKLN